MSDEKTTSVEYAKSNRSECVKCHKAIGKDAIRIGRQFHANHEGQRYYHLKCWAPKDSTRKPADYVFGFEHLQPKDQIAVNKHCGFDNEAVIDPHRHVAGVASQAAAQPAPAVTAPAAFPSFPSSALPQPSSFGAKAPQVPHTSFSSAAPALTSGKSIAQAFGAFGSGSRAQSSDIVPLQPQQRTALANTHTLDEALTLLGNVGCIPKPQAAYLLGPMHQAHDAASAKAALQGAYELYRYDNDSDEFLHTIKRLILTH